MDDGSIAVKLMEELHQNPMLRKKLAEMLMASISESKKEKEIDPRSLSTRGFIGDFMNETPETLEMRLRMMAR